MNVSPFIINSNQKMYKQHQQPTRAFRFRRFCRAGWAAFRSMHREVTIGRLAVRVADSSLAKCAVLAVGLTLVEGSSMAQTDDRETRTLPEVTVTAATDSLGSTAEPVAVLSAADFQQSTIHSIADLVAQLPGVDIRVRGGGDVQGDLSMRGGTFDQTLLLLNGINLTDAQTGHHTLDIPIDITMVERVELLSPAQCLARGISAFCGAVNIVVNDQYRDRLLADLSGGSYGTANASLLGTKTIDRWTLTAAAAYHRSDGYRHNTDYRHASLLLQAIRHGDRSDWHLQLGGQAKDFGSAGFYSTTYPDQYEATRTLTASATHTVRLATGSLQVAAYGRLHRDRFELFRDGWVDSVPAWYGGHNHHLSSIAGLNVRYQRPLHLGGRLVAGADVRREGIWSNVLGKVDSALSAPFTHSAARTTSSLFAGYQLRRGPFGMDATVLGAWNTQFGPDLGLCADVHYRLPDLMLCLSASRTYRLPTFTDLYYQGANQVANPDLGPEHSTMVEMKAESRALELGADASLHLLLSAYYRAGRQIIDWVRPTETEMWYSMNHTAVDALGIDAQAALRSPIVTLMMRYSFCHISQDAGDWISGSALDYLRHQLHASAEVSLLGFRLMWATSYRLREGQYIADGAARPYGGAWLHDVRLSRDLGAVTLYGECHNLLDVSWRDHGGVPQPGRTWLAGLRLDM